MSTRVFIELYAISSTNDVELLQRFSTYGGKFIVHFMPDRYKVIAITYDTEYRTDINSSVFPRTVVHTAVSNSAYIWFWKYDSESPYHMSKIA